MTSTEHKTKRESHWHYVAWVLVVVLLVIGFRFILTSTTELSNYFWLGILLVMLSSSWYGYDKGYTAGMYRGYERGLAQHGNPEKS
jgi:hypothetical protein